MSSLASLKLSVQSQNSSQEIILHLNKLEMQKIVSKSTYLATLMNEFSSNNDSNLKSIMIIEDGVNSVVQLIIELSKDSNFLIQGKIWNKYFAILSSKWMISKFIDMYSAIINESLLVDTSNLKGHERHFHPNIVEVTETKSNNSITKTIFEKCEGSNIKYFNTMNSEIFFHLSNFNGVWSFYRNGMVYYFRVEGSTTLLNCYGNWLTKDEPIRRVTFLFTTKNSTSSINCDASLFMEIMDVSCMLCSSNLNQIN